MDLLTPHLTELQVALTPDDPRRIMPAIPAGCRRVLDVGCGAGQTLIASDLAAGVMACGTDRDLAAVQLGHQLTERVAFVCSAGERLPFRSESFDLVISRVALPYMHVPTALAEMRRVLVPGGRVWLVLHPLSTLLGELVSAVRSRRPKAVLGRLWVLANGVTLHLFGTMVHVPFTRAHWESFQTTRAMRRALRPGFQQIEIRRRNFFVVTATRRG